MKNLPSGKGPRAAERLPRRHVDEQLRRCRP